MALSPRLANSRIARFRTAVRWSFSNAVRLAGAIVFHAFNGLRIILVDFWSWATRNQKVLFYVVVALWVLTMLAFTPRHLINVFSH